MMAPLYPQPDRASAPHDYNERTPPREPHKCHKINFSNDSAAGPELLALVLTGVFGEEEDFIAAANGWSIRQIVAHIADSEMVGAQRMRQVIAEDNPTPRRLQSGPLDRPP